MQTLLGIVLGLVSVVLWSASRSASRWVSMMWKERMDVRRSEAALSRELLTCLEALISKLPNEHGDGSASGNNAGHKKAGRQTSPEIVIAPGRDTSGGRPGSRLEQRAYTVIYGIEPLSPPPKSLDSPSFPAEGYPDDPDRQRVQ